MAGGHSPHTIRALHRVLRSALNEAVRRRRLGSNPALIARPPRAVDVEVEPLTIDESRHVLAAAQGTLHPARWSMALSLGLRQGEALGLLWEDLNLDDGLLRVRRSVQRHTWEHGCPAADRAPSCGRKRGAECRSRTGGGLLLVDPEPRRPSAPSSCPSRWLRSCAVTAPASTGAGSPPERIGTARKTWSSLPPMAAASTRPATTPSGRHSSSAPASARCV
jgi:integrase